MGEPILQKIWIIWSPLLYFNFKFFKTQNLRHSLAFNNVLYDSEELLSEFWNFFKFKRKDLFSGRNQFCRKSELFGSPFFFSILNVLLTQSVCHSLDFNAFCMIKDYFSQSREIYTSQRGETYFLGKTGSAKCLNYLVLPSVFQFLKF